MANQGGGEASKAGDGAPVRTQEEIQRYVLDVPTYSVPSPNNEVPPARSRSSRHSSVKTSSSKASRATRQIEMTAAEELAQLECARLEWESQAKLQQQQLKIKEQLIKKKMEIRLQDVEEESEDSRSGDFSTDEESVDGMAQQSERPKKKQPRVLFKNPPRNPIPAHPSTKISPQRNPDPVAPADGYAQLAQAITQAIGTAVAPASRGHAPQSVTVKLPKFSGDPLEWPAFHSQYKTTTDRYGYSNDDNIIRLRQCLDGKAKDCVSALLISPGNVPKIIETLRLNFGRPRMIIKHLVEKARKSTAVTEGNWNDLLKFSNTVRNLVETIKSMKLDDHLRNPDLMDTLADKLPTQFQFDWMKKVHRKPNSNLEDLSNFVVDIAETAVMMADRKCTADPGLARRKERVFAVKEKSGKCHLCKQEGHWASECESFVKMDTAARWKKVREAKVCYCCLAPGHQTTKCRQCGINGCKGLHHELLHRNVKENNDSSQQRRDDGSYKCNDGDVSNHLPFLPVVISANGKEIRALAFLDEGCGPNLVDNLVVQSLDICGEDDPLSLMLCGNQSTDDEKSHRVNFDIRGDFERSKSFRIEGVRTMEKLGVSSQTLNVEQLQQKYKYLEGLPIRSYFNERPLLIVGQAGKLLGLPRKYVHGKMTEPVAYKTCLGWTVCGKLPGGIGSSSNSYYAQNISSDEMLHELVKQSFSTEAFGVKLMNENLRSQEDKRAFKLMEEKTYREGNACVTPLLWKTDDPVLPPSYNNAFNRLRSQERKMDKDAVLADMYCGKIAEYEDKGKIRLVFDAAAKNGGTSLNDQLMKGPDFLNPLPGVLMKFRRKKIGFTADITDMYHRVKVRAGDLPTQRFLFRGKRRDGLPDVYEMRVMIFGAACSPSSAQFVKNKNAEEFKDEYPEVYVGITECMYVDDYPDCAATEEQAIKQIEDVIFVNAAGNFTMCKWMCSSKSVLEKIPTDLRAEGVKELSLRDRELPLGRALGIWWDPETDQFLFRLKYHKVDDRILSGDQIPTKRQVLQLIMSIFDPLGFVAHFVVLGKMMLQKIWASGTGWDEQINSECAAKWIKWIQELQKIVEVKVPRCYSLMIPRAERIDLHVFVDASQSAFSCCTYLRVKAGDQLDITLVAARTRVATLKPLSIPKLELQAAVAGSRLGVSIKENIGLTISNIYHWSDSRTVLCWLKSDAKRLKMFFAHRVGEILEITNVNSWRWVPTADNVADDATRDEKECDLSPSSRWFAGPSFLKNDEKDWPVLADIPTLNEDEKEALVKKHFVGIIQEKDPVFNFGLFSSWQKLVTAWCLRYMKNLPKNAIKTKSAHLLVPELKPAELWIIRQAQRNSFPEECQVLQKGGKIKTSSRLLKLSPFLDEDGTLRMRTRLEKAAGISDNEKSPIILDGKSHVAKLIIEHYHRMWKHEGREFVTNEFLRKFRITGIGNAVQGIVNSCVVCRKRNAQVVMPEMGNIPGCKLAAFQRPFTYCGVDCFGPMEVTVKRSREKRYGMLFTCMTTRAVHIELLHSLSLDSCVQVILRMRARRGTPKVILSDNGTNFVGADRGLQEFVKRCQRDSPDELASYGIEWRFNPPGAPHMEGSWERLIRSVKKTLSVILRDQAPKDEVLQTMLVEAEFVVNNRPLTDVPLDENAKSALTPNDLLIGPDSVTGERTDGIVLPVLSGKDLRKSWQASQWFVEQFWRRWRTEYLPTLTRREKWNRPQRNLEVNDVVIVVEPNAKRNEWPLGMIDAVYPGKDGVVRVVDVRVVKDADNHIHNFMQRPVSKMCLLEKILD